MGCAAARARVPVLAGDTIMTAMLCVMLTATAVAAAPAGWEDPAAQAQATLRRVAKLPADQQKAWLLAIERRMAWASKLAMKPDEARSEQTRVAELLRQKVIPWPTLVELLRDLDQREKAAIGRLVRQYRAEVYETFGRKAATLVERQEAWYRVWKLWEAAGSRPEQQDRLIDWLAAAIRCSVRESIAPLPPDPKFGEMPERRPPAGKKEELAGPTSQPPNPQIPKSPNPQIPKSPSLPAQPAEPAARVAGRPVEAAADRGAIARLGALA